MLLKKGGVDELENDPNAYVEIDIHRWVKILILLKYPMAKIVIFVIFL